LILISTLFSTVIYLVLGELGPTMLSSPNPKFVIRLPRREIANVTAAMQPTKAAQQSTLRKTLTKNGEWLSTKPASVKRKKATNVKTIKATTKKIKAKPTKKPAAKAVTKKKVTKTKAEGISAEVIELSSDDDHYDTDPDVPLVSLRQVEQQNKHVVRWNDNADDDDDDENEFDE
jgi:hypothetical protein